MVDTISPPRPVQARTPIAPPVPASAAPVPVGLLTCSAMLLVAVIVERWMLASHLFPGDAWAARIGMSHKPQLIWDITRVYQQVGRPLVAIGEVAVLLAWLWRSAGKRETQGLLIVLLASATCGVIKILCGPTPLWTVLAHHVGTNFPSGVVTFMTATVGYVALVAWRMGRRIVPIALIVAIIGAGPARVVGGQHLISDVLGAYMLGLSWLLAALSYLRNAARHEPQSAPGRSRQLPWAMPGLESAD